MVVCYFLQMHVNYLTALEILVVEVNGGELTFSDHF